MMAVHFKLNPRLDATIDKLTVDERSLINMPVAVIRYQYDNHLGSASLELDATAQIISYEEYHPFGSTSYRSGKSETEVSLKRYKYVGKERDEETGLYYYGFRYYAPWIARFINVDPLQHEYPHYTPFQYAGNKPITYVDLDGLEEKPNNYLGYTGRQLDSNIINVNNNIMYFKYSQAAFEDSQSRNSAADFSSIVLVEDSEIVNQKINEMIAFALKNEGVEPLAYIIFNKEKLTISLMPIKPTDFEREIKGESYNNYNINENSSFPDIKWITPKSGDIFIDKYEGDVNQLIIIGQLHGNEIDPNFRLVNMDLSTGNTWRSEMVVNSTSKADQEASTKMGVPIYEIDITSGQINKIDPQGNPSLNIDVPNILYDALNSLRQNPQPLKSN